MRRSISFLIGASLLIGVTVAPATAHEDPVWSADAGTWALCGDPYIKFWLETGDVPVRYRIALTRADGEHRVFFRTKGPDTYWRSSWRSVERGARFTIKAQRPDGTWQRLVKRFNRNPIPWDTDDPWPSYMRCMRDGRLAR